MAKPRTGPRPLRGGMVRWLPTAAELATRSPIEITARDEAILRAVVLHGALTTDPASL